MDEITAAFDKIVKTIAEVDPEQEFIADDYVNLFRSTVADRELPWGAELQGIEGEILRVPDHPWVYVSTDNHATPIEALEALEQLVREAYG